MIRLSASSRPPVSGPQPVPGQELVHVAEDRRRRDEIPERQIPFERREIDVAGNDHVGLPEKDDAVAVGVRCGLMEELNRFAVQKDILQVTGVCRCRKSAHRFS